MVATTVLEGENIMARFCKPLVVTLCIAIAPMHGLAATVSFTPLGRLPGTGLLAFADDVSDDGAVVVGRSDSAVGPQAFRWTQGGGMVNLGNLPGWDSSWAQAVSADGSIVVGRSENWSVPDGEEVFMWTPGGGMVSLGDGNAAGLSPDGSVVVGAGDFGLGNEAFRWTSASGMVGLGDLPGGTYSSGASAVSSDGSVVVGASASTSGFEAFRWTSSGGMVGLGDLPGWTFLSQALDVSADGSVVVGDSNGAAGREAYRWTSAAGMVGLGFLSGGVDWSSAAAVSANGSVIVGTSGDHSFVWTAGGGMRRVSDVLIDGGASNVVGWHLQNAFGLSADGTVIVGGGTNPEGDYVAWMAKIPEPNTLAMLSIGSLMALRRRRRRAV